MRMVTRAVGIGLSVLALGAARAAEVAPPAITNLALVGGVPQFAVLSDLNITNLILYSTNLSQTNWMLLTNLVVGQSPYWFVDATAPADSARFYRVAAFSNGFNPPNCMAFIPGGGFAMGNCMNTNEGNDAELPLHTVTVSAFYMDCYEVTKALWDEIIAWNDGNGYVYDSAGSGKDSTHPVQFVNWYDCVKWCNARSEKEGLTPCYYTDPGLTQVYKTNWANPYVKWDANGYRLPTEAEWEKAARGGLSWKRFPWSQTNITHNLANYVSSVDYAYDTSPTRGYHPAYATGGYPYTSPVGSLLPNGYGLYDMAGNVWEWCWDWDEITYYSASPTTDPHGPGAGFGRVVRGGAWSYHAYHARCSYRYFHDSWDQFSFTGFRCVKRN